ncbi:MAG: hypothetical protein ABIH34_05360, partial [Nanoarchaeota archaeon]
YLMSMPTSSIPKEDEKILEEIMGATLNTLHNAEMGFPNYLKATWAKHLFDVYRSILVEFTNSEDYARADRQEIHGSFLDRLILISVMGDVASQLLKDKYDSNGPTITLSKNDLLYDDVVDLINDPTASYDQIRTMTEKILKAGKWGEIANSTIFVRDSFPLPAGGPGYR